MHTSNNEITKEVLFQKLGQTWYIFTEVNNEVIYSAMPDGMDPGGLPKERVQKLKEWLYDEPSKSSTN